MQINFFYNLEICKEYYILIEGYKVNTFSKNHTQIAKGIAIMLMMYYHLFAFQARIHCEYFSVLNVFGVDIQTIVAYFCKICVGIFVFVSGIGLYYSNSHKQGNIISQYKSLFVRALRFLTNFWIIFLIFIPIGIFIGVYKFNIIDIVLAFFGMNPGVYAGEWWFVSCYITLLFIFPCFNYLLSKQKIHKKLIIIFIYCSIYLLGRIVIKFFGSNIFFDNYFWYLENVEILSVFFVGMICAKFNVYGRLLNFFVNKINIKIILITVLIISVLIRVVFSNTSTSMAVDFIVVPIFVFAVTTLLYDTSISKFFILMGKHSTNIWLSHTFWCYYFWQPLVFLPYISTAIYLWLVILSLGTSFIINLLYVPFSNLVFSKEHRLSYKGYFK